MSSTTADRLAKWLVKIGKERAALWAFNVKMKGDDPFVNMFSKVFLAGGLGDLYASVMLEQFKFGASKANKHLYDFLKDIRNRGQLFKPRKSQNLHPCRLIFFNFVIKLYCQDM